MRQKIISVIFGLFLAILLLEITLRLSGFIFLSLQEYRNISSARQKGVYRIMCLGESTTAIGGDDSYPSQLEDILNQRNIGVKFQVINKGVPVVNTSYILAHVEENLNQCRPDMVITMMGTNDVYVKYYEGIPDACGILFNKLSTYRFFRLLCMNAVEKIRKAGIYNPEDKAETASLPFDISAAGLKWCAEAFQDTPELRLINDMAYLELARLYRKRGRSVLAEESLRKAIELNPGNYMAYVRLGEIYGDQKKFPEAEEVYKKAIELSQEKDDVYIRLGRFYRNRFKKPVEAEQAFKKAIEFNPQNVRAYLELGRSSVYYGKLTQAEKAFKKAVELNPRDAGIYKGFAALYSAMGKDKLSDEYYGIANQLSSGYYSFMTAYNYQELKMILDKRGIKLVCVQYPLRSIKPLKIMLQGQSGIIFVDNDKVFKDALKKGSLKDYFVDMFSGDFGHCTRQGNRLLAENIANAILKEYFKK